MRSFSHKPLPVILILCLSWLFLPPLACCAGPFPLSAEQVFKIIGQILHLLPRTSDEDRTAWLVISQFRLARVLLALFCGGALGLAGAILQGVLRNPLAEPFTLGISAGAACGASIALGFVNNYTHTSLNSTSLTSMAAFAGAVLALFATLLLGRGKGNFGKESVILAGIAVAAFFGAIVALVKALNEESVTSIVFWLMGSLQGKGWDALPFILIALLPALGAMIFGWRKLDILLLGDEEARLLGLSPAWTRFWLLCAASFMTAACVAICGIIGFVGLVTPHIIRLILGSSHGALLLASFLGAGIFLLLADCLARIVLDGGQELPVGVVTALTGGPFFAFLIWKSQ